MTDTNSLSALIGGYIGLLVGVLFVMVLINIFTKTGYLDMIPLIFILSIVTLILYYLFTYFDRISKGEVSMYYTSFSILSTIFLFAQTLMIFKSIINKMNNQELNNLFNEKTYALLGLLAVINMLLVITMGIVLHFYSTQG
jgi:uncharacterized membrane protein